MSCKLIELLKKATQTYTNLGEYYTANASECVDIEEEVGQQLFESYPIEITDEIYDNLQEIAKSLYPDDDFFTAVGSPVESKKGKVKLPFTMGSMTEAHLGELKPWLKNDEEYTLSMKLDGCSAGIVYKNGRINGGYTRGDGYEGQNITTLFKSFINQLPKNISLKSELKVRGELIVPKADIQKMLQELKEENGKTYKNGRNTVAGMINAKTISSTFLKYVHFVAYHIESDDLSENEVFTSLENLGFETPTHFSKYGYELNEDDLKTLNEKNKAEYEYEIDGIIITKNEKKDSDKGYWTGTINPKCSMKYKVGCVDNYAFSTITDIKWQLSSYGYFKPVIEIEPVELDGSTITYATGNNYQNVIKNHLCKGAKIRLHKAGLVIPFIDETIEYPLVEDYNLPNDCETSIVGVDLVYDDSDNPEYDKIIALQQLVYFCSKLGVEYAGEGNIKRMMEYTELDNMSPKNLLLLPVSVYQNAIGVNGVKFAESLQSKMKEATIAQFMDAVSAFGRGIGELKLNKIIDKYGELVNDYDKIIAVDGWSDVSAKQYMEHFIVFIGWLEFLRNNGYNVQYSNNDLISNTYANVVVVFTGIRDKALEAIIKNGGGKIVSSCTKACNLVIAKDVNEDSTKLNKARQQSIEIIDYDEALKRFK